MRANSFAQWERARGNRTNVTTRPFGRDWEKLLADAELQSGLEQEEAVRDAQALATAAWLRLQAVKYYPNRIARVFIPLDQEDRWKQAFGFTPVSNEDIARFRRWAWESELSFCTAARLLVSCEDVRRLDAFLKEGGRSRLPVPIKERSLDIFGDEKRLDELYRGSALFDEGRLTLMTLRWLQGRQPLTAVRPEHHVAAVVPAGAPAEVACAPTGRDRTAEGEALGIHRSYPKALQGRDLRSLGRPFRARFIIQTIAPGQRPYFTT